MSSRVFSKNKDGNVIQRNTSNKETHEIINNNDMNRVKTKA